VGECSRCGTAIEPDAAWCGECGLPLKATSSLPTPEAMDAAAREQRWLAEREGDTGWTRPPEQPERPAPGPPARQRRAPAYTPRPTYKPIAIRAHILRWWLVAGILVDAAVTVLNAIHLSVLDPDSFAGSDAVIASDERLAIGAAAVMATFWISAILWLFWFHRAYRNVESFGTVSMRFGTGWAVGAWFVPILNWFRPKQIANDIWRGTDPNPPPGWIQPPVAPLVHWWWAAWLVGGLLGNVTFRLITDARTLDAERVAVAVDIVAGISYVVSGVLALRFVRAVTEREAACAAAIHGAEADADRVRTAR
jgi:eukaryotic-like serine/threonine-protein kinase